MKALVIDDSRAMRSLLRRLLVELGFEVLEAQHGREALEQLGEAADLRLALVDWNMPEMNGMEFVAAVRRESRYAGLSLMMVTTETESGQVVRALEAGANEYLMKPFSKEALVEKLDLMGIEHR